MLKLDNVTISYKNVPTVQNFNLDMKEGQIVSLVGESGSGKTTVIRAVLGLLAGGGKVTEGSITFEGEDLLSYTPEQWRKLRGSDISMIFQDNNACMIIISELHHLTHDLCLRCYIQCRSRFICKKKLRLISHSHRNTNSLSHTPEQWRKLRGSDISMIFQDSGAMMNPTRKVGKVFTEYILTHEKISKKEAWSKGIAMLERMRLPSPDNIMESYPFQLSGDGSLIRSSIAIPLLHASFLEIFS